MIAAVHEGAVRGPAVGESLDERIEHGVGVADDLDIGRVHPPDRKRGRCRSGCAPAAQRAGSCGSSLERKCVPIEISKSACVSNSAPAAEAAKLPMTRSSVSGSTPRPALDVNMPAPVCRSKSLIWALAPTAPPPAHTSGRSAAAMSSAARSSARSSGSGELAVGPSPSGSNGLVSPYCRSMGHSRLTGPRGC